MTKSYDHVCLKVEVFVDDSEPKHRTQNTNLFYLRISFSSVFLQIAAYR